MPDIITVTIPDLPLIAQATGEEEIAVWDGARLSRIPQAALRGTRLFSGPSDPPAAASVVLALKLILSDRWRNTQTGDEWKVTALVPLTWTPDGNVRGADGISDAPGPPGRPGDRGPRGYTGEPGTLNTGLPAIAKVAIPAETVVVDSGNGMASPCDPANPTHRGRVLGYVKNGGGQGAILYYQPFGRVPSASGDWGQGDNLFVADGTGAIHLGGLTKVPPTAQGYWRQRIAVAVSATEVDIAPGPAARIGDGTNLQVSAGSLNVGRRLIGDADCQVLVSDATIVMGTRTASRTVTLCSETAFPPGQEVCIFDGSGQADTFPLTIATKPGERIVMSGDPMADRGAIALNAAFGRYSLKAVGGGTWSLKAE